jgi:tRNA (adenine22-N1)-methyltransferase
MRGRAGAGASITLSARLQMIWDCLPPDQPLWDIGCDHGYLGLRAHHDGLCSAVHLVDRSPIVTDKLHRQVQELWPDGPGEGLQIWQHDAASEQLPVTGGTVVLAGLGIWTILRVLSRTFSGAVPAGVRLVLAAIMEEELLRLHLCRQGWRLQHEELYAEAGHVRQLLVWESTGEEALPFWNGTSPLSQGHGLLGEFLSERRRYFSVNQSADPDLAYLKKALNDSRLVQT